MSKVPSAPWTVRQVRALGRAAAAATVLVVASALQLHAQGPPLELRKGDRIVLLGNTTAERLQQFNNFETRLAAQFPDFDLVVRNLGWSGDTITLQPRPLNFGDAAKHLKEQKPDVILAFFGMNESFDGAAGLPGFEKNLDAYLTALQAGQYSDRGPTRIALISPIAQERLARLDHYVDVDARNRDLSGYTEVMRRVAERRHVTFVDLYAPTKEAMAHASAPMTINGIHLNDTGDRAVASLLMAGLGLGTSDDGGRGGQSGPRVDALEKLRTLIAEKNQQFFYRWRPVNAEYVVGRRLEPFGAVNFPPEMRQLDAVVTEADQRVWAQARALRDGSTGGGRK